MNVKNDCLSAMMFNSQNMASALEHGVEASWFNTKQGKLFDSLVEAYRTTEWHNRNGVSRLATVFKKHDIALDICSNTPSWAFKIEDVDDAMALLADERARELVGDAVAIASSNLISGEDPFEIIGELISVAEGIDSSIGSSTQRTTEEIRNGALEIDTLIAEGKRIGLPFPWINFQRSTFGIPNKSVTPLAGRDGKGKSRLAQFLTYHWVAQGIPILYFPFEDTSERALSNMASTHGGYDMFDIKRHFVPTGFMDKHRKCLNEVSKMPLYMDDFACTAERIVSTIAMHKRKYGIEGVVIDGFKDLIASKGENRTQEENHMMGVLVRAAHKYDVAIIPVSHLTKVEDDKWISKHNIKGSGNLTQSARMSLMFQDCAPPSFLREKYPMVDLDECVILDCQKASYGTRSVVVLSPDLEHGGFNEIYQPMEDEEVRHDVVSDENFEF